MVATCPGPPRAKVHGRALKGASLSTAGSIRPGRGNFQETTAGEDADTAGDAGGAREGALAATWTVPAASRHQIVELTCFDAVDPVVHLGTGEHDYRAAGMSAVAYYDVSVG